jgi:spore germination cell wall hydrolase CwlJ-like protein
MDSQRIKNELTDRMATGLTVFGEARREPLIGQHAIAWVIRTRTERPKRFGVSWKGVCLRPSQFSCWYPWGGPDNYAAVMAAALQLVDGQLPKPGSALARALQVADDVIAGLGHDPTHGADHYYAPAAMNVPGSAPTWAHGKTPTAVIGGHRFYRLG